MFPSVVPRAREGLCEWGSESNSDAGWACDVGMRRDILQIRLSVFLPHLYILLLRNPCRSEETLTLSSSGLTLA